MPTGLATTVCVLILCLGVASVPAPQSVSEGTAVLPEALSYMTHQWERIRNYQYSPTKYNILKGEMTVKEVKLSGTFPNFTSACLRKNDEICRALLIITQPCPITVDASFDYATVGNWQYNARKLKAQTLVVAALTVSTPRANEIAALYGCKTNYTGRTNVSVDSVANKLKFQEDVRAMIENELTKFICQIIGETVLPF